MARPRKTNGHLPKYVVVNHGSYWYQPTDGKAVRIGPEGEEWRVYEYLAKVAKPQPPPKQGAKLHDHFERYKREIVPTLAPRTQKDYARHIVILDKAFGHQHPDEVLPKEVGAFLDRTKGRIQANRQVAVLSAIYAKMVGRWYVADRNPCRDVERNPSKKRTRYVTDVEFAAVRALASPRVRLAMDLALITGQRRGDLISLPFKNVSSDGILFQQGKTGKRLLVSMSEALQAVIDTAKAMAPVVEIGGYVLRTRSGRPYTAEGFAAVWQRTMNKAQRLGAVQERFTFHDLRAKSVSDSKNLQEAYDRAGHTSMSMTRGTYDRGIRKVTPLK